ncbi:MAG: succinylglutamate desuccinylase/aspartoacylase family protein [Hyphomonas sp.]|nr:succinylglutamate desuccinylase/aspartoacylase family protein [Hyphomonas sp.]
MTRPASGSRIWATIPLDGEGKQAGHLCVPVSENDTGYAHIPIPITVIRNGAGPRVLLMAGNHGDEYEGQVILMNLSRMLAADDIAGTVYIISGLNAPAVEAGTRVSPLDGGNLNRQFPGDPRGTATQMIAHYVEAELLSRVGYVFDLHSAGRASEYLPSAVACDGDDPALYAQARDVVAAFGLPIGLIVEGSSGGDLSMVASCQRKGVVRVSTELPGSGAIVKPVLDLAQEGLLRALHRIGLLRRPLTEAPAPTTRFVRRHRVSDFLYTAVDGIFEPFVSLGDLVEVGQCAGLVHDTRNPWREPVNLNFKTSGLVLLRRAHARVRAGQCVFATGTPED